VVLLIYNKHIKKIIELIQDEEFEEFKKLVPPNIVSQFFNLKKELDALNKTNEEFDYTQLLLTASIELNEDLNSIDEQDPPLNQD
jgi:hypothetical protein